MTNYNGVAGNAVGTQVTVSNPVDLSDAFTAGNDTARTNSLADWMQRLANIALNIATTAWAWTVAHTFARGFTASQNQANTATVTVNGAGAASTADVADFTGSTAAAQSVVSAVQTGAGNGMYAQATSGPALAAISTSGPAAALSGNGTRGPLALTPQATPGAPVAGDVWVDTAGAVNVKTSLGTVTIQPTPTPLVVGGTGVAFAANITAGANGAPRYWLDHMGVVHLSGGFQSSATGGPQTAFTLPVGYRPSFARTFPTVDANGTVTVSVSAAGVVQFNGYTASANTVSLDGMTFETF